MKYTNPKKPIRQAGKKRNLKKMMTDMAMAKNGNMISPEDANAVTVS